MKKSFIKLALVSLLLNACVKSLHPLTDNPNDMIFKKELLGKWKHVKENTDYIVDTIPNTSGKTYALTVIDHNADKSFDTSNFVMMLVKLEGNYFVDCVPDIEAKQYSKISDANKSLLLPAHFFSKVFTIDKNLIIASVVDNDELSLLLNAGKIKMGYQIINKDEILLIDNPGILQQKLVGLDKYPSVYKKKDSLIRVSN